MNPRVHTPGDASHIAVTAEVYAHVRLRLQHQAIEALGQALADSNDPDDAPLAAAHTR
ncbi:integrase [Streptomyces sp. NPDC005423]|uniref:integrase n=1 Tax=Streptomyces sp. NPDC005423 TaxID=3155343 RepID=UPI0033A818A1